MLSIILVLQRMIFLMFQDILEIDNFFFEPENSTTVQDNFLKRKSSTPVKSAHEKVGSYFYILSCFFDMQDD